MDSVVARFRRYDATRFREMYGQQLDDVVFFIDSLNTSLALIAQVETLSLDHSFENIGTAAFFGRTIYLSASFFFLFSNPAIVRSAVRHEFGHILYQHLRPFERARVESLWTQLGGVALLYLFREGEYSANARFGGHPYDSPGELFASGFNLLFSQNEEFQARCRYVDSRNLPLIRDLENIILNTSAHRHP
jgi:hypothetical protein